MSSYWLMFPGFSSSLASSGFGLKPPASGFQSYSHHSLKSSPSPFEDNGLPFWVPDVLWHHSGVVLWNFLSVQMFFWWICGGESGLPVLFLCHLRVFSNVLALHISWPKYWSFSFSISPSNEYSGLISFRIDWFDLLAFLAVSWEDSRVFCNTTAQKHQFFDVQPSL